ncbi:hypothetical protein Q8W71_26130 [Methylobacterium sp. NEAU 140]|uniref:DUF6894 family protein n=1 Tax=Methylobacterium sp. NEAU 140 TaxID=3064945 RepID=UPI002736ED63|nr:hypothetical protein [Methylobacterium sp. NEAU 140]MDP4026110.1 hypothetical protein [Methylobacterium sp. NEAU 140]
MPLYFFDTADLALSHRDVEGTTCRDVEEARRLAVRALVEIMADCTPTDDRAATIRVRDAAGEHVYAATLRLDEHR